MNLTIGDKIKIIEGEKVTFGIVQKLFPSGTSTVYSVKLETGGLKCYNGNEIYDDDEGNHCIEIAVQQVVQTKKKGLFGFFKK